MYAENNTVVVYLTGKPGVGKYTVAKALSTHEFIICDNQLINNPIFELLQYDGYTKIPVSAWKAVERIREAVLDFLTTCKKGNYVLTNNLYENKGDRQLYEQVKQMALTRGSAFIPIRLMITEEEHLKRITQFERRKRWKSIDPQDIYDQTPLLKIDDPHFLNLNITDQSPTQAAEQIIRHTKKFI